MSHSACSHLPHLEGQVLEEVRGAARLVGLGSGASVNPDTNGRSLRPWRVLSRDLVTSSQHPATDGEPIGSPSLTVRPFLRVVVCVLRAEEAAAKPRFHWGAA